MKKVLSLCLILIAVATALTLGTPVQKAFGASACMTSPSTANCDGQDPIATGCSADVIDLITPLNAGGVKTQLRYSPTCKSAWARASTPLPTPLWACVERKPLTTNSPKCYVATSTDVYTDMLYLGRNTYYGRAGGAVYPNTLNYTTPWKLGT